MRVEDNDSAIRQAKRARQIQATKTNVRGRKQTNSSTKLVGRQDGKQGVDADIAEQEGTEEQIASLTERVNPGRVFTVARVVAFHDNF